MLNKRSYKYCYMCEHFLASSVKAGARLCRIGLTECQSETTACDKFSIGKFFYCNKRNQWKDLKACASIRATKKTERGTKILSPKHYSDLYSSCTNNCKQGQQIEFLFFKECLSELEPLPIKIKLHRRIKIKRRRNV